MEERIARDEGKDPRKELTSTFGKTGFRDGQAGLVSASTLGMDTFALMATGSGKSLCALLPGYCRPGTCVVFSPLIALMHDQIRQLQNLGLSADAIVRGEVSTGAHVESLRQSPLPEFLFLTPEMYVASEDVKDLLSSLNEKGDLSLFMIDEAHLIDQWEVSDQDQTISLPWAS